MCGIAGCIAQTALPRNMQQSLQRLAHRGPDDAGFYTKDNVWLGNTRLAIQDLTDRGHQPMRSNDGRYTLVYNGELYNNAALRQQLTAKGITFRSASDTETLLQAFIQFGADCLSLLNGIFAFAVYDEARQELFIARDALGVKPLYYYQDPQQFLFASELKALLDIQGLDRTLAPEVFYNYLLFLYNPSDSTPFRQMHKLPPGHYMRITQGQPQQPVRYYQPPFNGRYNETLSEKQWIARLDETLQEAVRAQMVSDAPIGFFLSGGLDSSLVAALARQQRPDAPLTCFTVDTGGHLRREGFADDLHFARLVAQRSRLNLIDVPGNINIAQELDELVWHLDEPQADPAALHVKHIAQAAQQRGIKVLLSGTGADDVFSGYRRHQALRYESWMQLLPDVLLQGGVKTAKALGGHTMARRLSKLASSTGNALQRRIGTHFWMQPLQVATLFQPELTPDPYAHFEGLLEEIPHEHSPLNQLLYWELRTFLPQHNLNYTDKMSMAAGVETRVPYLDTCLIGLSAQMPPRLKMRGTATKYILREVAKRYLPREVIHRSKTGFAAPLRQWMQHDLQPLVQERLLSGSLQQWNIFNPAAIAALARDTSNGRVDGAYTLFGLLAIESWLRQFAGTNRSL